MAITGRVDPETFVEELKPFADLGVDVAITELDVRVPLPATDASTVVEGLLQRLAEVHAGRAWVEEREGGGASFRVFLPDVTEVAAETAGQAADRTEADANVEETDASEE